MVLVTSCSIGMSGGYPSVSPVPQHQTSLLASWICATVRSQLCASGSAYMRPTTLWLHIASRSFRPTLVPWNLSHTTWLACHFQVWPGPPSLLERLRCLLLSPHHCTSHPSNLTTSSWVFSHVCSFSVLLRLISILRVFSSLEDEAGQKWISK